MTKTLFLAAASAAVLAAPAHAQAAPGGLSAGDTLLRVRAILVAPQESSGGIQPTFPNEEVKVNNFVTPEVDVTYMVSDHVGLELIAATSKHHASGKTGTTGSIGRLASTWVLPPTLTAQYHFNPKGAVRPYLGAGVNYTIFYNEKASDDLEAAVGDTDVRLSSSFGPAVQAGIDVDVAPNLFVNVDVKWIDMDTTATLDTVALGREKVRIHLDPLVIGAGVGFKF